MTTEKGQDKPMISEDAISVLAFELYCARGCEDGHDVEDWLQAEAQLRDEALANGSETQAKDTEEAARA